MSSENATEQEPVVLTTAEFIALAKVSRARFYQWKKDGRLEGLQSNAPNRWARVKVLAWLNGQEISDRRRAPRVA